MLRVVGLRTPLGTRRILVSLITSMKHDWQALMMIGYYETANVSSITSTHDETSYSTIPDSKTDWPTASVSTYTLCDGTPRATISPATTSFVINATQVYSNVEYTVSPATPSAPCQPNQDDCAIYYFGSNIGDIKDDNDFALSRRFGACGNQHDAEQPCLVQGGPVKLLYFPVCSCSCYF